MRGVPELSIVIPTFNTAAMTLRSCRAALAAGARVQAEVIAVDDGSTDGTAALLVREVPDVRVVRLEENCGFAVAANRGVAVARGSIVLLLNSDAIIDGVGVRELLGAFAVQPRLGVAGAQLVGEDGLPQWSGGATPTLLWIVGVVSGTGHLARLFRRRPNGRIQRDVDWVSGAAMAFRRETWSAAGPLDERFLFYCQDLSFCVAARDAGWDVRIVPEARVIHALGATIAGGSALHHDPELLWHDLLDWGRARHGRAWGALARLVLVAAAWMRIAARTVRSPLRRDPATATLVSAARRLSSLK